MDNLAEKVHECLNHYVLFAYSWDHKTVHYTGCLLFTGCLSIEVKEGLSGLSELTVILWVSTIEGCLLSRVP